MSETKFIEITDGRDGKEANVGKYMGLQQMKIVFGTIAQFAMQNLQTAKKVMHGCFLLPDMELADGEKWNLWVEFEAEKMGGGIAPKVTYSCICKGKLDERNPPQFLRDRQMIRKMKSMMELKDYKVTVDYLRDRKNIN